MRKLLLLSVAILFPQSPQALIHYTAKNYSNGGLALNLSTPIGSIFRPGEGVRFSFETQRDAHIIVFDIDTDGYVHLLYPEDGKLHPKAVAGRTYRLPEDPDHSFLTGGSTGMELVFALAVPERSYIDEDELVFLAENEYTPREKKFRIDGDPFLAANMIAGELIRGISHREGVSLSYTYFFINDRVDYPRYICAECHDESRRPYAEPCEVYAISGEFEETSNLSYPLGRGFDIALLEGSGIEGEEAADEEERERETARIYVSFYPYVSHAYAPISWLSFYDPWFWPPLWYDPWAYWWYDPFYAYPYSFSFYFGWSWRWGWGSWGWYNCYDPYYGYYSARSGRYMYRSLRPHRSRRFQSTLYAGMKRNASRDPAVRISSTRYKGRGEVLTNSRGKSARGKYASRGWKINKRSKEKWLRKVHKQPSPAFKRDRAHRYNERKKIKTRSYTIKRRTAIAEKRKARYARDRAYKRKTTRQRDSRHFSRPYSRKSYRIHRRGSGRYPPSSSYKSQRGRKYASGSQMHKRSPRSGRGRTKYIERGGGSRGSKAKSSRRAREKN